MKKSKRKDLVGSGQREVNAQAVLLDAIIRLTNDRNGISPTLRELATETRQSPSMVVNRLKKMEELGLVSRIPKISRSVRVTSKADRAS